MGISRGFAMGYPVASCADKPRLDIGQPELAWARVDQGSGLGHSALVSACLQRYT
jgi:hypothetical protein